MREPSVTAFVLCDDITTSAGTTDQKDLSGAGLAMIRASDVYPIKRSFWTYLELADGKPTGNVRLAIMRADSGRRLFFRSIPVQFSSPFQSTLVAIRVFECVFPAAGVYYVELWYDENWVVDQRLEVI